jgi:hypothetical protein
MREVKKMSSKRFGSLVDLAVFMVLFTLVSRNAAWGQAQETAKTRGLTVTVLVYSGRQNPSYVLDDSDALKQLKALLDKAKTNERFEGTTVIPSQLGYSGIIVSNESRVPALPFQIEIYKKDVAVKNEGKKFLIDEGQAIETLLLDEAIKKGVIDKKILEFIKSGKLPRE